MALSRQAFDKSKFRFYVVDTDPPKPEYEIVAQVEPPGYPFKTHLPNARIYVRLEGDKPPYKLVVEDHVDDYGNIGHHPSLKKKAREWFEKRYSRLFQRG